MIIFIILYSNNFHVFCLNFTRIFAIALQVSRSWIKICLIPMYSQNEVVRFYNITNLLKFTLIFELILNVEKY